MRKQRICAWQWQLVNTSLNFCWWPFTLKVPNRYTAYDRKNTFNDQPFTIRQLNKIVFINYFKIAKRYHCYALLPWMRKVPLLLEPNFFFIHQYLRIKIALSVINSPQMCFDIWWGIYLSSCENFAPTCSAALTSPRRAPPSSSSTKCSCSAERQANRLQPTSSLTSSIRQTGNDSFCAIPRRCLVIN